MDEKRKRQLMAEYRQMKTYYGIIQLRNKENGKIFIEAVPNTKNRWTYYRLTLNSGSYRDSPLQKDWDQYGEEAFEYEVLWEKSNEEVVNMKQTLKDLKKEWLEKLQPFGPAGYNKPLD